MRTGKMRYRVTVQKPNNPDRRGQKQTWEDVATVWAGIRQIKVAEQQANKQVVVIGQFEIRIWSIPELDETWRAKHGNHIYNFVQVDEPKELVRETVIQAKRNKLKEGN